MIIEGKCHCGNITYLLDWPGISSEVSARACGCDFCVKHGGVWASNPDAKLSVSFQLTAAVSKYAFGTKTAVFHVCSRCGVVPIVTSEIAHNLYAVVNVNTFESFDIAHVDRKVGDFDGEELHSRLARRQRNWISDVQICGGSA
jgi:hypothetical protein